MAQENIYPFSAAGEDIQRLLPEHIGAAFKMVWDAPADSPEVLKQAGKQLALARKSARGASKKKVSDQDAVRESLRCLQLTRALNLIYRNREAPAGSTFKLQAPSLCCGGLRLSTRHRR